MKSKKIILIALFISLSFVGAFIKIPSPVGTLGLDSMPGFLAALLIGGLEGGLVALLGHLIIAFNSGFALTVPVHILIAFMMFIAAFSYGLLFKYNKLVAVVIAIIVNGIVTPAVLLLLPHIGFAFFTATTPFVLVASCVNIILSFILYKPLKNVIKDQ